MRLLFRRRVHTQRRDPVGQADVNDRKARGIQDIARHHDLKVHVDGARFANAVASLNCLPADLTWRVGVDVLCFGGVKNGLAIGEAVLFFDCQLAREFEWRVKQSGHLSAKMRFIAAPWLALIDNDVWLNNARHANAMARRLSQMDSIAAAARTTAMKAGEAQAGAL